MCLYVCDFKVDLKNLIEFYSLLFAILVERMRKFNSQCYLPYSNENENENVLVLFS